MNNYEMFADFYDDMMGDRSRNVGIVEGLIKKGSPKAYTVLELACGTGAILKGLSGEYKVSGLDISKAMLVKARRKLPRAKFYTQSMAGFSINEKFDVILCLFDSINHLLTLNEWKKVFVSAEKHLNKDGLFIFDMNTQEKLGILSSSRPSVVRSGRDMTIMDVTSPGGRLTDWKITVFEHVKKNVYKRHEETIRETSFAAETVKKVLSGIFVEVKTMAAEEDRNKSGPGRIYFNCRKK